MIAWVFGTIVMFFSASNGICGPRGFPYYFFKNDANCAAGSSPVCLTNKKGGSNLKVGIGAERPTHRSRPTLYTNSKVPNLK